MPPFEAHGNPRLQIEDAILRVLPDGPGNLEGVQQLLADMARQLDAAGVRSWAVLLLAETETLLTPEAEQALQAAMPQLLARGHRATAVALLTEHGRSLIDAQFRRIHQHAGLPFASFDSVMAAEAWLREQLAGGDR